MACEIRRIGWYYPYAYCNQVKLNLLPSFTAYLVDWGVVFSLLKCEARAGNISPSDPSPTITIFGLATESVLSRVVSLGRKMLGCYNKRTEILYIMQRVSI